MDCLKWKFWKVENIVIKFLVLVKLFGVDNTKKDVKLENGISFISMK